MRKGFSSGSRCSSRSRANTIFVRFSCYSTPAGIRFEARGAEGTTGRRPQLGMGAEPWCEVIAGSERQERLEAYVKFIIGAFAKDPRILAWDLWNEPDNTNGGSYGSQDPADKVKIVQSCCRRFSCGRERSILRSRLPSGVWAGDWSSEKALSAVAKIQLDESDVISFHNYGNPAEFEKRIEALKRYNVRFSARNIWRGRTAAHSREFFRWRKSIRLPPSIGDLLRVKTQTYLPWDSWQHPYTDRQPTEWFHEVFKDDGETVPSAGSRFLYGILLLDSLGRALLLPASLRACSKGSQVFFQCGCVTQCVQSRLLFEAWHGPSRLLRAVGERFSGPRDRSLPESLQ